MHHASRRGRDYARRFVATSVRGRVRRQREPLDETKITLDVRRKVQAGEVDAAVELLTRSRKASLKLRTFAPVLSALCELGDSSRVAAILSQLEASGLALGEEQQVQLTLLAVRHGDDKELVAQLRKVQESHVTLRNTSLASLADALNSARQGRSARQATVSETGTCSHCGRRLVSPPLSSQSRSAITSALFRTAATQDASFHDDLATFDQWLHVPGGRQFRHVIDAANVAYRQQNFDGGVFSFEQIEIARSELRTRAAAEPLIILPQRYLSSESVPNHTRYARRATRTLPDSPLSEQDVRLVQGWREAGTLWATPDGSNDDWYWLYAATVLPSARVLTNDRMRDHAVAMALGANLERWKARHVLRFAFTHGVAHDRPLPALVVHDSSSVLREVHSDQNSHIWHFPASEVGPGGSTSWLCVDLRRAPTGPRPRPSTVSVLAQVGSTESRVDCEHAGR